MVRVESALHENGFEHLRKMLQTAVASHEGRKKRGLQFALFLRQGRLVQTLQGKNCFKPCRAHHGPAALLHLPALQGQADAVGSWAAVSGRHRIKPHARRMVVLAGSGCSFDQASRNLAELCHLQLSNDVVRRVCDEEGKSVQKWMNQSPEPKKAFDAAGGMVEFSTDGLKINTVDGWREIRQSVISKRTAALPVPAQKWDGRPLEPPTVRLAVCAIAHCDLIGASWERLGKLLDCPGD